MLEHKPSSAHLKFPSVVSIQLPMSENQNSEIQRKLQGRTLKVYVYLQKKKDPSGIREIQRDLALSSPSVADYQIEKLVEMGLAARDSYGRAYLTKHVKVKALQSYVNVGQFTVPRLAFYASIFTAISVFYFVLNINSLTVYGFAVPAAAAAIFWYESVKTWRHEAIASIPTKTYRQHDNHDFWVSLIPGLGALAVFIASAYFLFYYIEPSSPVPAMPPIDPDSQLPAQISQPTAINDMLQSSAQTAGPGGSHGQLVSNFPPSFLTTFLFAGAVVAGFLVYVLVRYRYRNDVLAVEQNKETRI